MFLIFGHVAFVTLFSYLHSIIFFRQTRPLRRALFSSVGGYLTLWLLFVGICALDHAMDYVSYVIAVDGVRIVVIGLIVTSVVFWMLWRTFEKHWIPEADEFAARFD